MDVLSLRSKGWIGLENIFHWPSHPVRTRVEQIAPSLVFCSRGQLQFFSYWLSTFWSRSTLWGAWCYARLKQDPPQMQDRQIWSFLGLPLGFIWERLIGCVTGWERCVWKYTESSLYYTKRQSLRLLSLYFQTANTWYPYKGFKFLNF